jgi:hypothetical protein
MVLKKTYKYSFELFSAQNTINFSILNDKNKKIKIKKLFYQTIHTNQRILLTKIPGFDNHTHSNGLQSETYTTIIYASGLNNDNLFYVNEQDNYDINFEYSKPVPTLNVSFYTYNNGGQIVLNGDISKSNPIYIEFELSE